MFFCLYLIRNIHSLNCWLCTDSLVIVVELLTVYRQLGHCCWTVDCVPTAWSLFWQWWSKLNYILAFFNQSDLIYCVKHHFQQYFSYIMTTSFSGGRSRSIQREPSTMGKQLVNFITCDVELSAPFFVVYTNPCCIGDRLVWVVR
jgi:hypothetical protein